MPETNRVVCKNIPDVFFIDKNLAKQYFKDFGRIKKMIFKQKNKMCVVEYNSVGGVSSAIANGGLYNGHSFEITQEEPPPPKVRVLKEKDPDWADNPEIQAELEAMGSVIPKKYDLRQEAMSVDLIEKPQEKAKPALKKKSWRSLTSSPTSSTSSLPKSKKDYSSSSLSFSQDEVELINLIKQQCVTEEEKYKALDARDKLIRVIMKKKNINKTGATIGTCPDMCSEKERLMRVVQHQVALYEQEEGGRGMNPLLAVKQYSRSSADQEVPLPHELRPVNVLEMTMGYLVHKIIDLCDTPEVNLGEWFHFLWDRTRGIRKDITQQELCCQGSVSLVEQCARFHIHCSARLVAEDPSVFDQKINTENLTKCLQTLKYMYHDLQVKNEACPNEAEFRAYIILLNLNDGNFMWEVQQLKPEIQKSEEVKFAFEVYSALDKNNFIKFFKLVNSTTYLNACILMRYFVQVRTDALKILLKCYTPRVGKVSYSLEEITTNLGFDNIDSASDFLECYGMTFNEERTYVNLNKSSFYLPDYPYALDRSLKLVESKREHSVGVIVCNGTGASKLFETHVPQNSFDSKGYLNYKEYLNDSDLKAAIQRNVEKPTRISEPPKLYEPPKRMEAVYTRKSFDMPKIEAPPENKFTATKKDLFSIPQKDEKLVFGLPKPDANKSIFSSSKPAFGSTSKENVFAQPKQDTRSIFASEPATQGIFASTVNPQPSVKNSLFNTPLVQPSSGNIFEQIKPAAQSSIFGAAAKPTESIFGPPKTQTNDNIFGASAPNENIFGNKPAPVQNVFGRPTDVVDATPIASNMFSKTNVANIFFGKPTEQQKPTPIPSFPIDPRTPEIIPEQKPPEPTREEIERARKRELELKQKELEEKIKIELERKRVLEEKQKQLEEKRKLEAKRKEELRKQEAKRKEELRLQELKRIAQEKQKAEELKNQEIRSTVSQLIPELISKVELILRREKLHNLRQRQCRRVLRDSFTKWKTTVTRNKRKRRAIDCTFWVNTKTPHEEALELHTGAQDETLKNIKRYKRGAAEPIQIAKDVKVGTVQYRTISDVLTKRICELGMKFFKDIYWKITVSVPDRNEYQFGLNKLEDMLRDYFQWAKKDSTVCSLEKVRLNGVQTITYCMEKQQGLSTTNFDSNGFIFFAHDLNITLCKRIIENLKNFGVFVKVPIVLILQVEPNDIDKFQTLIKEDIISNYLILIDNFKKPNLASLIMEGLIFLAKNVEKPPPLLMDTLKSFLLKNLCTEVWKKANSLAKWNSDYKNCLKCPNTVISLYNEALEQVKRIILNKACFEFAVFPEIFKNFLQSDIPSYLPCDYKYFPTFYRQKSYFKMLQEVLNSLEFPSIDFWPPKNEFELELNLSKYLTQLFQKPEKPFYKCMALFLKNVDPSENFDDLRNVLWTDIVEVLATEKINDTNFLLADTVFNNKSIFNQLIVVYDPIALDNFGQSDWFYINNPLIKGKIKSFSTDYEDFTEDEVTLNLEEIESKIKTHDNLKARNDIQEFNKLLKDLEESMDIHKRISSKFEENLNKIIKED